MTDTDDHITDGYLPPEPEIDWEARAKQMFSENIRQAERYKGKIRTQGERIQELERINATQAESIRTMRPAHERQLAAEKLLIETQENAAKRINDQNGIIRELRKQLDGGERAAIESAIWYLNERARRLPALPKEAMPAGDVAQ